MGGLGNQLFQYALGRQLSIERNVELVLDITDYANSHKREFELNFFNTHGRIANNSDLKKISNIRGNTLLKKILKKLEVLKPIYYRYYIKEPHYHYYSNVQKIGKDAYLEGYWQSEKYFKNITEILKNDFQLSENKRKRLKKDLIDSIKTKESVSLHVRRGDYVNDTKTNDTHGLCGLDYYKEAVYYLKKRVKKPLFIVFSDDINWCKKNLDFLGQMLFIEGNNEAYEDIYYMSLCKHHIIANSTFSWWGAWLGNNDKEKLIIAPRNWFKKSEYQDVDLIPEKWIRL
jgi:hypothetical protein